MGQTTITGTITSVARHINGNGQLYARTNIRRHGQDMNVLFTPKYHALHQDLITEGAHVTVTGRRTPTALFAVHVEDPED